MLWTDRLVRSAMSQCSPPRPLPHCHRSTRRRPSLAPALLSTCTRREYMVKVIQCHWIFRILWYPDQTPLHLRVSQQLSEHHTEKMPLSLLYIPRKASRKKPQLMGLNRLRKRSLQPTTDSHQNHIPVLPGHSSANLKVLNSTTTFCQVTLDINLTCLQKPQLLRTLLGKRTVPHSPPSSTAEWKLSPSMQRSPSTK